MVKPDEDTIKVVIPKELKRRFKQACVAMEPETTMSAVVCELIEQWLKEQGNKT